MLKSHYEVSEPNTMQAVIGSIVAVSAFGAAYAAQIMFPIEPIADADLLLSQSTIGTVNILNKDSLKQIAPTPREMIDLYLKKQANLEDILDIITEKPNAKQAYDFLKTQEPTTENKFLIKACETHYGFVDPSTNIETQG